MSEQGSPPQHRPEDGWWQSVYAGPSATLPDTPLAIPDATTVDEWFDSAVGMIGPQRTTDEPPTLPRPHHPETVDEWFDSAVGMIGPQRTPAPAEPDDVVDTGPADAVDAASADVVDSMPADEADVRQVDAVDAGRVDVVPADEVAPAPVGAVGVGPVEVGDTAPADAVDTMPADVAATEPVDVLDPMPADVADVEPAYAVGTDALREEPPALSDVSAAPAESADGSAEAWHPEPAESRASAPVSDATLPDHGGAGGREPSQPEGEPVAETPAPEPTLVDAVAAPAAPAAPVPPLRRPRAETPVPHVGERPPTYGAEPTAVPEADPEALSTVVPDTVIDGAQYGTATVRAVSVRGDSARYRGEPRRDALLLTRFGDGADGLLVAVLAGPGRGESALDGSAAAAEAARQLAAAIGRSRDELSADLRTGARDRLRYGLQRLTNRAALPLRTAAELEGRPDAVPGSLHCLLVSLDPEATHRAAFGTGPGGLYLLRSGHWIDAYAARLLHHPDGEPPLPPAPGAPPRPFRFRLVPATPGDILLLGSPGLADPLAEEPAVAHFLANHWAHPHPPGTVDFLRQVQVRAKGYSDDRTAIALWTE